MFFFLGGAFAVLIRLELLTPPGDLMQSDTYNKMFTLHGVVMVFLFLIPAIPATLGNFLVPMMIGARDLAFPRINLLSWYLYIIGAIFTVYVVISGGVDTGWTFYTPYSTEVDKDTRDCNWNRRIYHRIFFYFNGTELHRHDSQNARSRLTWFRLPLFIWAHYATSLIMILGTPVIAITLLLVVAERALRLGIFDPSFGWRSSLFQHLFWFYSHPAVYIMILPAMGVISELVAAFSRKRIFGYSFVAFSSLAIARHRIFCLGTSYVYHRQSVYAAMIFSILSFLVAIPSAIKVFNWTATLYKGSISYATPMLYAFGFIGLFLIGGLTGLFLASLGLDIHVHDTYFIVAHFHYIMVGGTIMAYLGGLHYWWPKISGKLYPEGWARFAALVVFIGFNLTFFPQFVVGYLGMPRRYHFYPEEFQVLNVMSSAGASILGIGYLIPMIYFVWSMRYGPAASSNPWNAKGLEWETPSPPPTENFPKTPVVTEDAYAYSPKEVEVV